MTSNLPAHLSDYPTDLSELSAEDLANMSPAELDRLMGAPDEYGSSLPSLRVNYNDIDDDGNDIPRGQWCIFTSDGRRVFAPSVKFRILAMTYQYSVFDADEGKLVNKSIHFRNLGDKEVKDMKGGVRCGKLPKKQVENLSEAEKKSQRAIKLARVLFGVVSMEGKDQHGNDQVVENEPCIFFARGSNYMPMEDHIGNIRKNKQHIASVVSEISLNRKKNGGVVYWEAVPSVVDTVTLSGEDKDLMLKFFETIGAENEEVLKGWEKHAYKGRKKLTGAPPKANDEEAHPDDPDDDLEALIAG